MRNSLKKLIKTILPFCFLFFSVVSVAQQKTVTGSITSSDGVPIPGATIVEKGTNNGVLADFDGKFSSTLINPDAILIISHIGYMTVERAVGNDNVINVILQENAQSLDEVVVIGYGTVQKSDLTGSVSSLKSEDLEMKPISTMEEAMQGRLAGVNISSPSGEPGGGMNIIIRGASSISGGNQPLYVIDGIPYFNNSSDGAGDYENNDASSNLNPMASLNPNDIESIEVLKDASSTAIYGSRGANGVIMITTKQGKPGKGRVDINYQSSYSLIPDVIPLVDAQTYAELSNELKTYWGEELIYDGTYHGRVGGGQVYFPLPEEIPALMGEGTNWQEVIMQHGLSTNLNARLSGGSKDIRYNVSAGLLDTEGILKNTDFNRYTFSSNLNAKISDLLSIDWNTNGSIVSSNRSSTNTSRFSAGGAERSGIIVKAFMASPVMGPNETYFNEDIENSNGNFGTLNPLVDLTEQYHYKNNFWSSSNLTLRFQLSKSLQFVSRGGIRYVNDRQDRYWNTNTAIGFRLNGRSLYNNSIVKNLVNENFFTFKKSIKGHNLNVVAGMSVEEKSVEKHVYGFQDYNIEFKNGLYYDAFANGQDPVVPITTKRETKLVSGYGRLSYNYGKRYYLTATARTDGSSVFAQNNKWAFFPSVGFAWNFHNERFMNNTDWLSLGKLRASYGLSGNQAISPYQSLSSLGSVIYSSTGGRTLGILPVQPGNTDLKWETTSQLDTGIDLGFFRNRYRLTFDYYNKTTNDLLLNRPVLSESGYGNFLSNFGKINNEGFEVGMVLHPIKKPELGWSIDMNWSTNKAKILELEDLEYIDFSTNIGLGGIQPTHRLAEGGKIGNFVGFLTDGLLTQEDLDNGYPIYSGSNDIGELKYVDLNGDGEITNDDRTIIGNAYPDYLFGINNTINYKDFRLSFLIRGAIGQEIMNMMLLKTAYETGLRGVPSVDYYNNRWTPENPDGYYPRIGTRPASVSDRLIEDGSYIRLQNVTLSYQIPETPDWLRYARLYVTGFNLLTIHNYSGYDPEISSYGQNLLRGGVDRGSYPRTTTFSLGLSLGF